MGVLRKIPLLKILVLAEIALMARRHYTLLTPNERRRLAELVRKSASRKVNITSQEREELIQLVAKAEPRRFALLAADKMSPVKLPKTVTNRLAGDRQTTR